MFRLIIGVLLFLTLLPGGAGADSAPAAEPLQIAFMPDVHFHDVYGEFRDGAFAGLPNSKSGRKATIRSMRAQLHSTRLFNENYFALLAALDDAARRGVKLVALPGDFSDDGQPVHIRGLRRILDNYSQTYGMRFFATPGNHDPVRPFDSPGGEPDFLGAGGHQQAIFSRGADKCLAYQGIWAVIKGDNAPDTICSEEIRHLGYGGILAELASFGFFPDSRDLYWESPYSDYQTDTYSFHKASQQAELDQRNYEICAQGTGGAYKQAGYSQCRQVADASYLVEPVPGLWLLAIDANVYVPKAASGEFAGSGNAGYNKLVSHKTQVLDWIRTVVKRAASQGKTLLAFSHFPMTEFYDGQSQGMADLFGAEAQQLARRPTDRVGQLLADTGLTLHVGGHMHFNDTGRIKGSQGNTLINIQAPSLAAYVPAYKLLTLHSDRQVQVDTIVLNKVPRFDELFEHYALEYQVSSHNAPPWDKGILTAKSYREFTLWHLQELTRLRFLPGEWPKDLREALLALNGWQLMVLSGFNGDRGQALNALMQSKAWQSADISLRNSWPSPSVMPEELSRWTGFELALDFYRLRNAGSLALADIPAKRILAYQLLAQRLNHSEQPEGSPQWALRSRLSQLLAIFQALQQGEPDKRFRVNLDNGQVIQGN
ncbi:metallophosphoesterase [Bowmanella denitrificans]|uniref:metallophosphoesterase n=1 Tax=Bowmanella denitrificans TaxID=366582 RepID=UPI000C9B4F9D|nr:metallophosphoesterase [Bowmanella denitrificans]